MKKSYLSVIGVLSSALILSSCGDSASVKNVGSKQVQTVPSVESSLKIKAPVSTASSEGQSAKTSEAQPTDKAQVAIQKDALGKDFLLQGNLIIDVVVPQFQGIKSRIVRFEKHGSSLYMLESTKGQVATNELPQHFLLASFPILSESGNEIVFDFNKGMSQIFASAEWYSSDVSGKAYQPQFNSLPVSLSYLSNVEYTNNNQMMIDQIAQVSQSVMGMDHNTPVEVKYYLSPYVSNPNFKPMKTPDMDRLGFFEVSPQLDEHGLDTDYVSKFDDQKAIVYEISANTPKEYRAAIRDGILYWNKAFGRKVVEVEDAPAGVTAPDINHNVVQWVTWDQAGFAYADAQMDPLTGETLHAQIFLTSMFAFLGKERARYLLKKLSTESKSADARQTDEGKSKKSSSKKEHSIALMNLFQKHLCYQDYSKQLDKSLAKLVANDASDRTILKVSQDYIREVVAHEVGHTLGLRHNFTGSTAANFPLKDEQKIYSKYLETGSTPKGIVTTSSVMDYQLFPESTMTGDEIAKSPNALEYDTKAIQALYMGRKFKNDELPLFCTDSSAPNMFGIPYMDCLPFDVGSSAVEYMSWAAKSDLESVPYKLLQQYIAAKTPFPGVDPTPLEDVYVSPARVAKKVLGDKAMFVGDLEPQSNFIRVDRKYSSVNDLNKDDVEKAENKYVLNEVKRLGGLTSLELTIKPTFASDEMQRFESLLKSGTYFWGTGQDGMEYGFTDDDIQTMTDFASRFFDKLQQDLVDGDVTLLSAYASKTREGLTSVSDVLGEKTENYVLPVKEGENFYEGDVTVKLVQSTPAAIEPAKPAEKKSAVADDGMSFTKAEIPNLPLGPVFPPAPDKKPDAAKPAPAPTTKSIHFVLPKFLYSATSRKKVIDALTSTPMKNDDHAHEVAAQALDSLSKTLGDALGGMAITKINIDNSDLPTKVKVWLTDNKRMIQNLKSFVNGKQQSFFIFF